MKYLIILLFGVLLQNSFYAQECRYVLKGKVIDYHDRTPLVGATILVHETGLSTVSDIDGKYQITGLCQGDFEVEVSHIECLTTLYPIEIKGNKVFDFKMEHHLEELQEVEVVGNSNTAETNSGLETTLGVETLENFSIANIGDALRELSGISSLNTGSNIVKPAIHGLTGSRVLILNDGVRMQDMEWGDEHAPNVDINASGNITIVKGATALKYGGDAIGGVILMQQPKIMLKDSLFGKTIIGGMTNGLGMNVTSELTKTHKNGWFVKTQGSYKRIGDQRAPDYVLSNTGMREIGATLNLGQNTFAWGWDARYAFYNAEIAILRASHIGNVDDLIRSINSGEPLVIRDFTYNLQNPRQQVTHHLGKLNFYRRFEGLGKWTLQYDFQSNRRFEYDIRRGEDDDRASIDLQLTTHTLSTDFKWDANPKISSEFGLLGRYQTNFPNPDTGVRRLIPDYEKWDVGAYAISKYQIGLSTIIDAGLRYDFTNIDAKKFYRSSRWEERGYNQEFQNLVIEEFDTQLLVNPIFDFHNFSTTLGVQHSIADKGVIRLNYALAQRAPNPAELFSDGLHHSAARIELGDLRLTSERSHKMAAAFEKNGDQWSFTLEPYINYIDNFMVLEPTGVEFTVRGAFPVWSFRQTDVRLLGFDLESSYQWSDAIRTNHQFSLVKGTDMIKDTPLINVPAADFRNSLTFRKPGWNDFELTLRSDYVFRQNETPANITVFSPRDNREIELAINDAPDAYHLLGLHSNMAFDLGDKVKMTTTAIVNNALNTRFRDYLNRQRYFADDLGRNIILQVKFNY